MNENKPTSSRAPKTEVSPKAAKRRTYRRPQVHDLGSLEKVQGFQYGYYNDFTARQLYRR
jgi:hypothetical protein